MECVRPWYTEADASQTYFDRRCLDKSDQVFNKSLSCSQHLKQHIDYHNEKFCNGNNDGYDLQSSLICTNKTRYFSEAKDREPDKYLSDPHSCQLSCSVPGPDCQACSNSSYFQCPQSGQCVHPDLVCDGHPQCQQGEDEDLDRCHQIYIENNIVEPFASKRCKSPFYNNMEIYATPCNNKVECADGSDESDCKNNVTSNIILSVSSVLVLIVFLGLTVYHYKSYQDSPEKNEESQTISVPSKSDMLIKYKENHDDNQIVEEVNLFLLHSIHTNSVEENAETLTAFYDLEEEKHNRDEAEIYLCIHNKIDTSIVSKMIDAKFPGFLEPIKKLFRKQTNMINKSERAKTALAIIQALIKIELKYLDMFKDLGLSFLMLELIGGTQAIIDLPTNFGSVMVVVMLSSVFLPMILSTIHLRNNKDMKNKILKSSTKIKRLLITGLFYMLSPFHPIFLDTARFRKMEMGRILAQQYKIAALEVMQQCKMLKRQLVTFMTIELGTLFLTALALFMTISLKKLIFIRSII